MRHPILVDMGKGDYLHVNRKAIDGMDDKKIDTGEGEELGLLSYRAFWLLQKRIFNYLIGGGTKALKRAGDW